MDSSSLPLFDCLASESANEPPPPPPATQQTGDELPPWIITMEQAAARYLAGGSRHNSIAGLAAAAERLLHRGEVPEQLPPNAVQPTKGDSHRAGNVRRQLSC